MITSQLVKNEFVAASEERAIICPVGQAGFGICAWARGDIIQAQLYRNGRCVDSTVRDFSWLPDFRRWVSELSKDLGSASVAR